MAEGVFEQVARSRGMEVQVDSAGTGHWHVGEPPDERGQAKLLAEGIDISAQRARQICTADFDRFDLILAMDNQNHTNLLRLAEGPAKEKVKLFAGFANLPGVHEIPDPYYGGDDGFDRVFDLINQAVNGLADYIQSRP